MLTTPIEVDVRRHTWRDLVKRKVLYGTKWLRDVCLRSQMKWRRDNLKSYEVVHKSIN